MVSRISRTEEKIRTAFSVSYNTNTVGIPMISDNLYYHIILDVYISLCICCVWCCVWCCVAEVCYDEGVFGMLDGFSSVPHYLIPLKTNKIHDQEDKNPWCLFSRLIHCVHVMRFLCDSSTSLFLWSFVGFQTAWIEWLRSFLMEKSKLFNWIPSHDLLIRSAVYQTHLLQPPPPQNCYHLNPHLTRHGFTGSPWFTSSLPCLARTSIITVITHQIVQHIVHS